MQRDAKIILIVGGRGSGKTFFLEQRLSKDNTIVVELIKTTRWAGYEKVFFDDLLTGKVTMKQLGNKNVVFEDATSYISSNMSNYLRRLITNSKQFGCDVWLVFHSVNVVPVFLWYMWNNLVLFKCAKPRETAQNADYIDEILQKWKKCQIAPPYHFEQIESQL